MVRYLKRRLYSGINLDLRFAAHCVSIRNDRPEIILMLQTPKGTHMQNRRVYKNGNSFVMTLAAYQLNHIGVMPGQYVRVETRPKKRLLLSKAPPRIQQALSRTL